VFAGGAGFSTYWAPTYAKKVTLIEIDPVIFGIWDYLIRTPARKILELPSDIDSLDEIPHQPQEVRWLIGFHFNHGLSQPGRRSRSNWARQPRNRASFWSETIKYRLAHQVEKIRDWQIIHGSYEDAPDIRDAHWHIDPPYQTTNKKLYRCHDIDYGQLADWCRERKGFIQVCEKTGADWLPFREIAVVADRHRRGGATSEAIFEMSRPFED
jgi:site-specific DNA-adenine methylase